MLVLSKLLPLLVLPLGVSLILILWGLARRRQRMIWAGVLVILVSSNPLIGRSLIRSSEHGAERMSVNDVPAADAIVVLSAGRVVAPGKGRVSEWTDANRFFGGVELFHAGRAPLLVFTGASLAWDAESPREGDVLAMHASALGVPTDRIAVTALVSNTADEAREVARLLRERHLSAPRVLLVTSAFHMTRARQIFERQSLAVEPFPVDFCCGQGGRLTVLDLLPDVGALSRSQTAVREFYGRIYYRFIER